MNRHLKTVAAFANIMALSAAIYLLPGCSPLPVQDDQPVLIDTAPEGIKVDEAAEGLRLAGLGPGNTITGAELRIKVEGVKDLDAEASIGMAITDKTKTFVSLNTLWHRDDVTGAIVINAEDVRAIMSKLPNGPVTIILGMAGRNGEVAANAQFQASKLAPQKTPATIG